MNENSVSALLRLLRELGFIKGSLDSSEYTLRGEGPIRVLSKKGLFDEYEAISRISEKLNVPVVRLDAPEVSRKINSRELVERLTSDFCWKHRVLPLWKEGHSVVMAFANPLDYEARKYAEFALAMSVSVVLAEEAKITRYLNEISPSQHFQDVHDTTEKQQNIEVLSTEDVEEKLDKASIETAPVIRLCNKILGDAVRAEASDIHIEPTQQGVDVRFRMDGVMHSMFEVPKRLQSHVISRFKLMSGMDIAEKRRPQDGRMRVKVGDENVDMRVSSILTTFGEKIVMRVLRSEMRALSFANLAMPPLVEERLRAALGADSKMILVTGPTGSGKTTTLYTCLNSLRDGSLNVQTVEDPIEYRMPGINQVQVNPAINVTFASALRSILRQDPDVIMVGEIRDAETAGIAVQAAQTGHLVLSTLHTNSAPAALTRLGSLVNDFYALATSLSGVLAQRLLRKFCPHCKKEATEEHLHKHKDLLHRYNLEGVTTYVSVGCDKCMSSGYKGRSGVYSYLELSDPVIDLVLKQASISEITKEAQKNGYEDLDVAAVGLVKAGITSFEEARPYLNPTRQPEIRKQAESEMREHSESINVSSSPTQNQTDKRVQSDDARDVLRKHRILIVEDDNDVRAILSARLRKEMYEVIEAENGYEGIKKVYENSPELVLCDLMMPGMDGRQFLIKMRSNPQTKKIPIIILTAVDTESNESDLLDMGASDFISKTAATMVMLSRIRKVLA